MRTNKNQKEFQQERVEVLQKKEKSTGKSYAAVSPFGGKSLGEEYEGSITPPNIFGAYQRKSDENMQQSAVQLFKNNDTTSETPVQKKENNTGLPDNLKSGIENLSGFSMNDVKVHYNSDKPAQLQAHAYAQGTDIHLASGQEKHLPHEAWHVVQQKQGRVKPTVQMKGKVNVNDDKGLEREADVMGAKAVQGKFTKQQSNKIMHNGIKEPIIQGYFEDRGYRVADDLSVVTKDSNPWNRLYAKSGKADASNIALLKVGASIELVETSNEVTLDGTKLKQIEIKNVENKTQGDNMKLYADCGRSNSLIVGSLDRSANYENSTGETAQTIYHDPEMMKYEIMVNHFSDEIANASTILATMSNQIESKNVASKNLEPFVEEIKKYHEDINVCESIFKKEDSAFKFFMKTYNTVSKEEKTNLESKKNNLYTKVEDARRAYIKKLQEYDNFIKNTKDPGSKKSVEIILNEYWKENKAYEDLMKTIMDPYNALKDVEKDAFDKKIGINKYANPSVGSGYTTSSGGESYANKNTWNFHWGGVVMESDDTKDKVVLENYSVGDWNKENTDWDLQIYGTQKKDQTFHEQHKATQQHGEAPTTMNIKKK